MEENGALPISSFRLCLLHHNIKTHPQHSYISEIILFLINFSWRISLSYRNQTTDLLCKSMDCFPHDRDLCNERANSKILTRDGLKHVCTALDKHTSKQIFACYPFLTNNASRTGRKIRQRKAECEGEGSMSWFTRFKLDYQYFRITAIV